MAAEPIDDRSLPLYGRIAAGLLHEAVEQDERVDFMGMFDPADKDLFVLEVHGESMIDDQIADGDYVVVRKQRTARKGQIVVALTDEEPDHAQRLGSQKETAFAWNRQTPDAADLRPRRGFWASWWAWCASSLTAEARLRNSEHYKQRQPIPGKEESESWLF